MVGVSPLSAQTLDQTSSIFYPLPAFLQGKVFVAKQLFLGDEGGIWIHDIHGKVVFFYGQTIFQGEGLSYQNLIRN